MPGPAGKGPKYQQGLQVMPLRAKYYQGSLQEMARLNFPFTFKSTQWEQQLTIDPKYFALPPGRNPNAVTPEGEVLKRDFSFRPGGVVARSRQVLDANANDGKDSEVVSESADSNFAFQQRASQIDVGGSRNGRVLFRIDMAKGAMPISSAKYSRKAGSSVTKCYAKV